MAAPKLKVIWREWEHRPTEGFGHGVEFHDCVGESEDNLVAFLEGFDWFHGLSDEAVIHCIKPNADTTEEVLSSMKQRVKELLTTGKQKHGQISRRITAWFNA